jgi:alpha-1,6-mannosyltransferase
MLYSRTGGGVRTYYDAKLDWFRRQNRHRYVLIVPGPRSRDRSLTSAVTVVEARGIGVARGADSYRIFVDVGQIRDAVRRCQPDVLEAGDPWVSGPLSLFLREHGQALPLLSSFFHSDPIPTYLQPLLSRTVPRCLARPGQFVSRIASRAFYGVQASYDVTMVSSSFLEDRLKREGVARVKRTRFGTDAELFDVARKRQTLDRPRHLLYVGRLDRDKQVDLLLAVLPRVLEDRAVFVTVAGTGALRSTFERWKHPRFRYVGYVPDRGRLAALYEAHDMLLAPGAHETFGLAALEAAAAGLIIVGPDRGGTGDLLREMQSPFSFRAGDQEGFLTTIRTALRADWPRASRESRALAARYGTWPDAIARLVGTYERLVETERCRCPR